jgi:hypothetical protein
VHLAAFYRLNRRSADFVVIHFICANGRFQSFAECHKQLLSSGAKLPKGTPKPRAFSVSGRKRLKTEFGHQEFVFLVEDQKVIFAQSNSSEKN